MYVKQILKRTQMKRVVSLLLIFAMCLSMLLTSGPMAFAGGTASSDPVDKVFVYATDSAKKKVLLNVIPMTDIASQWQGATNYYASFIDALPTATYVEGQGMTITEFVNYVKTQTTVANADKLAYSGLDKLTFESNDGAIANYTYNALCGVTRNYYPALYENWSSGEISNVEAALVNAVPQPAYLAVSQSGGRVLNDEALKAKVAANGGKVTGCMADALDATEALRLVIPQTDADIQNGTQTFNASKKWINKVTLKMVESPITSLGTVATPTCAYELNGTTMTITLNCDTEGASIYHSYDGASATNTAQHLYTSPIVIENYDSSHPFILKYQAVKAGYDDGGVQIKNSSQHTVADASPNFVFALTNAAASMEKGKTCTVNPTLTGDKDFSLYGAEFQVKVPNEFFTVGTPTANEAWQVAKTTVGTNTVVTFTYLNKTGVSQTANTAIGLGSIPLTAIKAGSAELVVGEAIVTKADATKYAKVTGTGLGITIGESAIPISHAINVAALISGGTITAPATGVVGTEVAVTVAPSKDKQLQAGSLKYTADGGETYNLIEAKSGEYSFVMPAGDVLITGKFEAIPTAQSITVQTELEGGTISVLPTTAIVGTKIAVTVLPNQGKQLKAGSLKYTVDGGLSYKQVEENAGNYSFVMPRGAVSVVAEFEDISAAITVDSGITGGTVTSNLAAASTGYTIELTIVPEKDMQLKVGSLKFTTDNINFTKITKNNGIYSFVMPKGAVTVTAEFETIAGSAVDTTWYTANPNANSFSIATAAQLAGLALLVNDGTTDFAGKMVSLANDIDLQGSETNQWTPIGTIIIKQYSDGGWTPSPESKAFCGLFNGCGHTIKGLYINNDKPSQALFGCVQTRNITDFTVEGSVTSTTSGDFVAGVAAYSGASIDNVFSKVTVVAENAQYVGGIAGYCDFKIVKCANYGDVKGGSKVGGIIGESGCDINRCFNKGNITATKTKGLAMVGGLAGCNGNQMRNATIDNCYSTGNVGGTGGSRVGGLVGYQLAKSLITNSYNAGAISGAAESGAIVGYNESTLNENNYSVDTITSSGDKIDNGISKTIAELKASANLLGTFVADDADKPINNGYPVLYWQVKAPIYYPGCNDGVFKFSQLYATAGTLVTAKIVPLDGYEFIPGSVYYQKNNNPNAPITKIQEVNNTISFLMPAEDTRFFGKFVKINNAVTVKSGISGGNITVTPDKGQQWSTIVVNVAPDTDMRLRAGSLRFKNLANGTYTSIEIQKDGSYSFRMPLSAVEVEGAFESTEAAVNAITIDEQIEGGVLEAKPAAATSGTEVVVTVTPNAKRALQAGSLKYITDGQNYTAIQETAKKGVYSFVMPNQAVTLTAIFDKVAGTIKVNPKIIGGVITTDKETASAGDLVTVVLRIAEGNKLKAGSLKYTMDGGKTYTPIRENQGGYSFVMPSGDVVIDAKFEADTDYGDIAWYNPNATSFTLKTADQLKGLAGLVNNGITDFADKTITLAKDINLNGSESNQWQAIGTAISQDTLQNTSGISADSLGFAGTLDGGNHKISGLFVNSPKAGQGLFAYNKGMIKNLVVEGTVISTSKEPVDTDVIKIASDFTGGIVAFNKGTIDNVTSKIVVDAKNVFNTGGIAGFNDEGMIIRCSNQAAVTGLKKVGGLVGENAGIVRYSYNTGRVIGTYADSKNGVGGIAGRNGNNNASVEAGLIDGCYNVGTVGSDGQRWVGGIVGFENGKSAVINSYNAGNVIEGYKDYSGIVGYSESVLNKNDYSLNTTQDYGRQTYPGILKTEAELKAGASLMAAFVADDATNPLNSGYPVLYWQVGGVEPKAIVIDSQVQNGVITANAIAALKDSVITVKIKAEAGNQLKEGSLKYTTDNTNYTKIEENKGVYSFVMPSSPVTITGEFAGTQPIIVDSSITNGKITVKPVEAAPGNSVIVTVKADAGKQLKAGSLQYTTDNTNYMDITADNGVYSFVMPTAPVTIIGEFENAPLAVEVAKMTNGSVTVSSATATMDTVITVTVKADAEKQLKAGSLKYTAAGKSTVITATEGVYSFVMPSSSVTITGEFEDIALVGINIATPPTIRNYVAGQSFKSAGMVVEATYSDGSVKDITSEINFDSSALTSQSTEVAITYIYKGVAKVVIQPITMVSKALSSIEITKAPKKVNYVDGEAFVKTGMEVTATFNDGTKVLVSRDCTVTPNPLTKDTTTATVSYTFDGITKTASQAITVALGKYVEPTVSDKTASAKVDAVVVENDQPAVIETGSGNQTVNTTKVEISASAVDDLEKASMVAVLTDLMKLDFDKTAFGAVKTLAGSEKITLTSKKVATGSNPAVNKLVNAGYAVYDIDLLVNDKPVAYKTTGAVTVTVPYVLKATDGANGENLRIFYVDNAGNPLEVPCKYANGFVTFSVNHFSLYGIGHFNSFATGGGTGGSTGGGTGGSTGGSTTVVTKVQEPTITIQGNGKGALSKDGTILTITADTGYVLKDVTLNGVSKGVISKLSDLKTADKVVLIFAKAEDSALTNLSFVDVPLGSWFYDAIKFAVNKNLFNGITATTFEPNSNMTRGMLVTVLYRLDGKTAASKNFGFADVVAGAYYADAVNWAAANGIVKGASSSKFAPNDNVTREQLAAILFRYAQFKKYDTTAKADLSSFADAGQISAYAADNLAWANQTGLITGRTATTLAPQGNAARAEVAIILQRFVENIAK